MSPRPPLSLLSCGGTIAMVEEDGGLLKPGDSQPVLDVIAPLWKAKISHTRVSEVDSGQATARDWDALVHAIADAPNDKVLVTHGTDTLGWSAAAAAVSGAAENKTVVFTGANIRLGEDASDAVTNLTAALVALEALDAGVWVVFAGVPDGDAVVIEGGFARKVADRGACFADVAGTPYARVIDGELIVAREARSVETASGKGSFSTEVRLLNIWPGAHYGYIPMAKRVVVEVYATGTGPLGLAEAIAAWRDAGVHVVVVSSSLLDGDGRYKATEALHDSGAEVRFDLTAELAATSLMWTEAAGPLSAIAIADDISLVPLEVTCADRLQLHIDDDVLRWTSTPDDDLYRWVRGVIASNAAGTTARWCIHVGDDHAGVVGFLRLAPEPEIGWWLGDTHRGHGIGIRSGEACLHWAAEQGFQSIFAIVDLDNKASQELLGRLGFGYEKKVSWEDPRTGDIQICERWVRDLSLDLF